MDGDAATFFARMVNEAAAIATSGRWDAVNSRIEFLAGNPGLGNAWWVHLFGGLCNQTFSEYLALKRAHQERKHGDAALLAWHARNLLELSVWAIYCVKSRDNARRLYEDAGRDARELYDKFIKWGTTIAQDPDWLRPIESAKQDLSQRALNDGIESVEGPYKKVRDAAVECGFGEHFNLSYTMLSKFAHPTAMQIRAAHNEGSDVAQRGVFYSQGCLFFLGAFDALERELLAQTSASTQRL